MGTTHGAWLGRFIAVLVTALLGVLATAGGTASAAISTTTTGAFFSGAVPDTSLSLSRLTYCGFAPQPVCASGPPVQVSWGLPVGAPSKNSLGYQPVGAGGGTPGTAELGQPFEVGTLVFHNTPIDGTTGIGSVVLTVDVLVDDADRAQQFTARLPVRLTVGETANTPGTCAYPSIEPCADALLLPASPVFVDVVDGSIRYRVEMIGFADPTGTGPAGRILVVEEDARTASTLMARVTRTAQVTSDAGADQDVDEGTAVTLDGGASQGEDLTYAWRQVSGPSVALDDPSAARPSFPAGSVPEDTTLQFELTVSSLLDPSAQAVDTVAVSVRNVNQPPVLELPGDLVVTATGPAGAAVIYGAGATDPDGDATTVVCAPESGTPFPVGITVVECTASDGLDEVTGTFSVRVNAPPLLQLPADLTVDATSPAGAVVEYEAGATDDEGAVDVSCGPAAGTTLAIGATTVECTAVDDDGATASGSFVVTVRGAPEQLDDLLVAVTGVGPGKSLAAKVRAAIGALEPGNVEAACGTLRAFVNEIRAQSGKSIPEAVAGALTGRATRIQAVLACR